MKLPRWMEPVYITQVLTGLAGIGAIVIDDPFTKWHALVAAVIGSSLITSLIVTARTESDSERNRKHVETLLRAMELPYFIIKALTPLIASTASANGWSLERQEHFQHESVYGFRSKSNEAGRLVVSAQEFKDLWILEDDARAKAVHARLYGPDDSKGEHLEAVVRQAIGEHVDGPCRIGQETTADGARVFTVDAGPSGSAAVRLSAVRLAALFAMPPLQRYHAVMEDVGKALAGTQPAR